MNDKWEHGKINLISLCVSLDCGLTMLFEDVDLKNFRVNL